MEKVAELLELWGSFVQIKHEKSNVQCHLVIKKGIAKTKGEGEKADAKGDNPGFCSSLLFTLVGPCIMTKEKR